MKSIQTILSVTLLLFITLQACGPSAEEKARLEQARQDSLQQMLEAQRIEARADSLAQAMEQQRQQMEAAEEQQQQEAMPANFSSPEGQVYVQVEAWRSQEQAEARLSLWKDRGYPDAYVVQTGSEDTGDIWFRVRLLKTTAGSVGTVVNRLKSDFGVEPWIIQ